MATSDNRKAGMKAAHMPPEPEQLACPRCNSTHTKFCYYNNYNFSQPRHFCKSCRRYWTHGGTLRDIPVGGATHKTNASKRPRTAPSHFPSQVLFPLAADHGGAFAGDGRMANGSGSFTSLLNDGGHPPHHQTGGGRLALGGFGLDEVGRGLLWPAFPGTGGAGDSGHTWHHDNGESYFAISTPASVFK